MTDEEIELAVRASATALLTLIAAAYPGDPRLRAILAIEQASERADRAARATRIEWEAEL